MKDDMDFIDILQEEERDFLLPIKACIQSHGAYEPGYAFSAMRRTKKVMLSIADNHRSISGRVMQMWVELWKIFESSIGKSRAVDRWNLELLLKEQIQDNEKNMHTL